MPGKGSRVIPEGDRDSVRVASEVLRSGGLVVSPTDTIYGILADALSYRSFSRLRSLRRPSGKPFILLLPDHTWISKLGLHCTGSAVGLLRRMGITLVLRRYKKPYPYLGLNSLGVRIPAGGFVYRLLRTFRRPVLAPSANPEGKAPARSVSEAFDYFGEAVDLYVDGGFIEGKPSAVIRAYQGLGILRRGLYSEDSIRRIASMPLPFRPQLPCRG